MDIFDAVYGRRTIRKFSRIEVTDEILKKLVDCARVSPSAMNMQPLKYCIVNNPKAVSDVFEHTKWAGYLKGKGSPKPNQRPEAFILVLNDNTIRKEDYFLDAGAAIQTILLCAYAMGLDTCWLGSINRKEIRKILNIDKKLEIISAIAIGYADMVSVLEETDTNIEYYLDDNDVLHVPKRKLDDILI